MSKKDSVDEFTFDLRRTLLLSSYIEEWGMPKTRVTTQKEGEFPIEAYLFPGEGGQKITRISTIGLSAQKKVGKPVNYELLFVLPNDLGGARRDEVFNYLLDISVYSLRNDVSFGCETLIAESALAPKGWSVKAILVDEARGESEEFESMHVGAQHVALLWLVPIYRNEYYEIREHGIDSFDRYCQKSSFSLVDVSRPSVVPIQGV
jgi:hypothetical protein